MIFLRINVLLCTFLPLVLSNSLKTYKLPIPDGLKIVLGYPVDNLQDFTEVATRYGYVSERHTVISEDGYILKLYSMRSKHCKELLQPPVLIMHGLISNSDIWLDAGPNTSLPYIMADHCYNLWFGNVRGNNVGRKHVKLNPDRDVKFWDFTTDEMGTYDLPAIIDYIIEATHSEKINYVGHSQGGGIFVIMCSERPEYCNKVNTFVGLSPATRLLYSRSLLGRVVPTIIERFSHILSKLGIHEVFFKGSVLHEALEFVCKDEKASAFCVSVLAALDAYDPGSIKERTLQRVYAHFVVGTSMKNLVQYSQNFQNEKFQKFNYGPVENVMIYGSVAPPAYDLSKLKIPALIVQGLNDHLVDIRDTMWLHEQLPQAELKVVDKPLWTHIDMACSSLIPKILFPIVHKQLLKYSNISNVYRYTSPRFLTNDNSDGPSHKDVNNYHNMNFHNPGKSQQIKYSNNIHEHNARKFEIKHSD